MHVWSFPQKFLTTQESQQNKVQSKPLQNVYECL